MAGIDKQFDRAVDIVQRLPKGGPVQTSYDEKLWLYSLYKQAIEGDLSAPRPGLLDMLGRAKWDSWNKQRGKRKDEAKQEYVNALLKMLKRHPESQQAQVHAAELEAFQIDRPTSPASSTSSYHSSQIPSPTNPSPQAASFPPPDPSLPPPDVSPEFIPPSSLNHSHRSLLNLNEAGPSSLPSHPASVSYIGIQPISQSSIPRPSGVIGRDFTMTPEILQPSPHLGLPTSPYHHRPTSTSTFATIPPINVPATLQQIQLSLTALHERLSSLERTQAMILRRDERRRTWFWSSKEEDELEEIEDERDRAWTAKIDLRKDFRRRNGLALRLIWFILATAKRAVIDAGLGAMLVLVTMSVVNGGWRRSRGMIGIIRESIVTLFRRAAMNAN